MLRSLDDLLEVSPWAAELEPGVLDCVKRACIERPVPAGAPVCLKGEAVEHWVGIVDGLVKVGTVSDQGKAVTFIGVSAGAWFGEGSMLKREPRRYDATALRDSRIALMPRATFQWLLDTSIGFNRFLLMQLNERLGQIIATLESERLLGPEARVARCLAQLFNPLLYPKQSPKLSISQAELGLLTGLSRQRVNQALQALEKAGLLRVEYGSVRIESLDGLREFEA